MVPTNPFSKTFKMSPLTLDRILEGRPIAAQDSPLLRLPVDILSEIIKYIELDRESLAALALVNSDCRQLARSCQFANVVLDYSVRSYHLFGLLIREATERSITKRGLTCQPSLGACIRSITPSNHYNDETDVIDGLCARSPEENGGNNEDNENNTSGPLSIDQWRKLTSNITTKRGNLYNPSLILVFTSLPYLEIINWTTPVAVDHHLLTSLGASTVRHLKLHGYIDSESLVVELEGKTLWPLLSLDIDIRLAHYPPKKKSYSFESSPFFNSLFQACSSTLRFLKFTYNTTYTPVSLTAKFPHLCSLSCGPRTLLSLSTLRSFLQSPRLSTLVVDAHQFWVKEYLDQIGYCPGLNTLILTDFEITGYEDPCNPVFRFLEQNNQLTEFGIGCCQSASTLGRVIPILASFSSLKVLSLTWEGTTIPDSSLTSLALLTSLEKLHISARRKYGDRHHHYWLVDHDAIRNALSPLCKLRRIVITQDLYNYSFIFGGFTYSFQMPNELAMASFIKFAARQELLEANLAEMLWERKHYDLMVQHAENYAVTFPELEWMYLGELSFIFKKGVDKKRTAVVVNRERKECSSVLETMFGISDN